MTDPASNSVRDLLALLGNPPRPDHRIDWDAVEATLGLALPEDYKEFIEAIGPGGIGDEIVLTCPDADNPNLNFLVYNDDMTGAFRTLLAREPIDLPYPFYPDKDGLVAWAYTANGHVFYWSTAGPASDWAVVVGEARGPDWYQFDGGTAEFLLGLLGGTITVPFLDDELPADHTFTRY